MSSEAAPKGTIRDWIDMRAQSGAPAFLFGDALEHAMDWAQLREEVRRRARLLTALGISKGESLAIAAPNGRDAVLGLFAALYGGFRATMINLVAGDDAIAYALEHSEARFSLVHPDHAALVLRCAPGVQQVDFGALDGEADLHALSAQDDALLMYTSGTTGRPKGVVHSHASLLAGGWTTTLAHNLGPQDCGLCVLPIYHINALCVSLMSGLVSGGRIAVAPRFSASRFWDQISAAQASWFSVVPTIVSHLLHGSSGPDAAAMARLRFGRSASSALSPDVHAAFQDRFGVCLIETMGLTETAAQILANPLPPGIQKLGSPGLGFGNEVCILSPQLQPLAPHQQGEIAVRGPNVMRGYLKNPSATAESLTPDGWLRTGDLGHCDEDGYFYVTGRLKELIIKGGENIAPREVDEALYAHPQVVEAAAFARACKTYGETVEAAVVLREDADVGTAELVELCHARLGRFKSPDVIHVLAELPKGPSGKIQRLKIAEMLG